MIPSPALAGEGVVPTCRDEGEGDTQTLKDRIGFDAGSRKLEDALAWAISNGIRHVDFNADIGPNHVHEWSDLRTESVKQTCEARGVEVVLHTLSGVNVAEFSPMVSPAADQYLQVNLRLAQRLGCKRMIVHGGYHFGNNVGERKKSSIERLKRLVPHAERAGVTLLLENLNREPDNAEVHYLAHNVEECRAYFDAIKSERFGWAFTVNHAHLVPEGIDGFLDEFGIARVGEVRLADCRGTHEEHLLPGQGTINFKRVFERLERLFYKGHYSMAFGTDSDKLAAREFFVGLL
ncbi:MAG: sugar phosphate isomerase/epimerase [Chloroflexi bacterium]|nr:sugar phosphate isomerase/epimerase [Chloroflexota bacterium]